MSEPTRPSRRRVLAGIGALGLAAAGVGLAGRLGGSDPAVPAVSATTTTPTSPSTSTPRPTASSRPPLPAPTPYEPDPADVYREVKAPAGRFVQQLGTHPAGRTRAGALAAAVPAGGPAGPAPVDLGRAGNELHDPAVAAATEIVYAQLGGLAPWDDPTTASVIVVCRQRLRSDTGVPDTGESGTAEVVRTVEVLLDRGAQGWRVRRLAEPGGDPVARPADLPAAALAVLDEPRITLPDSARWDIHRGTVDERLLTVMAAMAERHPYQVTCLSSGHAVNVFGTDRRSHHADGRAVDIWAVDGELVAAQQPGRDGPAHDLHRWLFDAAAAGSLGGPWAFDGFGGRSFTDDVHLDHLHVAFGA